MKETKGALMTRDSHLRTLTVPSQSEWNPHVFTQTTACHTDPARLFQALELPCRPRTVLLESADVSTRQSLTSLLVAQASLVARCDGNDVTVTAYTESGSVIAHRLRQQLQDYVTEGTPTSDSTDHDYLYRVSFHFPPSSAVEEGERLRAINPAHVLRLLQREPGYLAEGGLPLLAGGFAYDFIDSFEELTPVPTGPNAFPDYNFVLAEILITVDHAEGVATVSGISANPTSHNRVQDAIAHIVEEIGAIQQRDDIPATPADAHPAQAEQRTQIHATATIPDHEFTRIVTDMQEHIANGDIYQVVPSRGFTISCPDSFAAYQQLRIDNPSPYMFYLNGEGYTLFGASPESNLKYDAATRTVELYPIAGTRPRGLDHNGTISHEQDIRAEFDLRTDAKELAEHIMLVDLARNDLARIAVPGTRTVADLLGVDRYSRVMHLVSRVVATLADDLDALDAYRACMNMGTLTGAPKLSATNLLRQAEKVGRGCYGGAVGYLGGDGSMDTCIVIRSAYVANGTALVQAGAGVVRDSDPQAEADETWHKASAVVRAIATAQGATVEVTR